MQKRLENANNDCRDELTNKDMHAVFVEVVEEVCLLRLVDGGEHVFWVQQRPDNTESVSCGHQTTRLENT